MSTSQIVDFHEQIEGASTLDELLEQLGLTKKKSPLKSTLTKIFGWSTLLSILILLISFLSALVITVLPWWSPVGWLLIVVGASGLGGLLFGVLFFLSEVPLLTEVRKKEKIITWCRELIEKHRKQLLEENTGYSRARAKLDASLEKAMGLTDRFKDQLAHTDDSGVRAELEVGLREAQAEWDRSALADDIHYQRRQKILDFFRYLDKLVLRIDSSLARKILFRELAELREEGGKAIAAMDQAIIDLVFSFQEEAGKLGTIFNEFQLHSGAALTAELTSRPVAFLVDGESESVEIPAGPDELDEFLDECIESVRAKVEVA